MVVKGYLVFSDVVDEEEVVCGDGGFGVKG